MGDPIGDGQAPITPSGIGGQIGADHFDDLLNASRDRDDSQEGEGDEDGPIIWSEEEGRRRLHPSNPDTSQQTPDISSNSARFTTESYMRDALLAVQAEQKQLRNDMESKLDMIMQAIASGKAPTGPTSATNEATDAPHANQGRRGDLFDVDAAEDRYRRRYEQAGLTYPGQRVGQNMRPLAKENTLGLDLEQQRLARELDATPFGATRQQGGTDPFRLFARPSDTRSSRPQSAATRREQTQHEPTDSAGDGDKDKLQFLKPPQVKPTDIGYFDPIEASTLRSRPDGASFKDGTYHTASAFWNNVRLITESYTGPYIAQWHAMIRQTLPFCLKNDARMWYDALTPAAKSTLASNLDAWSELIDEFRPSLQERELLAVSYRWNPDKQTAKAYYYQKMAYLVDWLPNETPGDLAVILTYIREGMDNYLAENIRAHLYPNPSAKKFLAEIKMLDKSMEDRRRYAMRIRSSAPRAVDQPRHGTASTTAVSDLHNTPKQAEGSLEDTYNAKKVSFDRSTTPPTRLYTTPRGVVLRLTQPCRLCKEWHFRFEHNALKANVRFAAAEVNWVVDDGNAHAATQVNWVEDDITLTGSESGQAFSPNSSGESQTLADAMGTPERDTQDF